MNPRLLLNRTRSLTLLLSVTIALGGCHIWKPWGEEDPHQLKEKERIAKTEAGSVKALNAAREGARITFLDTKDYRRALFFYKYLVLYSEDESERREAQRHIAEIYFERLTNYDQAVVEYNRLLQLPSSAKEAAAYRLNVAKAYFYLNKFVQADAELDLVIGSNPSGKVVFDADLLRANIQLATRQIDGAIVLFKKLLEDFPVQAREEHVGLSLAVCYEEKDDFKAAKEVLTQIRSFYPHPDFIDLKIKRLSEREAQLPGAKGLRK